MRTTWVWVGAGLLGWASIAMAGRPLMTADADPLERGKFQVEAGVGYTKEDSCNRFEVPLALNYGILPRVEAGIGFGGKFEDRNEHHGETGGIRYKLVESLVLDAAVGTKVAGDWPDLRGTVGLTWEF